MKPEMNKASDDSQTFYNDISPDEARKLVESEGIQAIGEKVMFYIQHEEEPEDEVDQKPAQLMTVDREDTDFSKSQERLWAPVMSVGPDVPDSITVDTKVFLPIRHLSHQAETAIIKGYSFGIISYKTIGAVKK